MAATDGNEEHCHTSDDEADNRNDTREQLEGRDHAIRLVVLQLLIGSLHRDLSDEIEIKRRENA